MLAIPMDGIFYKCTLSKVQIFFPTLNIVNGMIIVIIWFVHSVHHEYLLKFCEKRYNCKIIYLNFSQNTIFQKKIYLGTN